jgi:hypothetical protein
MVPELRRPVLRRGRCGTQGKAALSDRLEAIDEHAEIRPGVGHPPSVAAATARTGP